MTIGQNSTDIIKLLVLSNMLSNAANLIFWFYINFRDPVLFSHFERSSRIILINELSENLGIWGYSYPLYIDSTFIPWLKSESANVFDCSAPIPHHPEIVVNVSSRPDHEVSSEERLITGRQRRETDYHGRRKDWLLVWGERETDDWGGGVNQEVFPNSPGSTRHTIPHIITCWT